MTAAVMNKKLFIFLLVSFIAFSAVAQQEEKDSITVQEKKRANRAALFSIIPGGGQIYNHKYWKVPVIYAGFGALFYFIKTNNDEYGTYKKAILYRNDNDSTTIDDFPRFTNEDLTVRKDFYRRNRDLCYILSGILYTLNIVDAYVDSQLLNFDVGDNLSLNTGPAFFSTTTGNNIAGLQFTLTIK
jgi:hypothetical protein